MPEFRQIRSGSLTMPTGAGPGNQMMPRSPPNTSHVPCKFYRQGACQAGNACPFSHDLGASSETVCKYFAKGNCKFGPKCANIHVLPDGRRINYGKNGVTIGAAPVSLSGRPSPSLASPIPSSSQTHHQASASALTSSLYRANHLSSLCAFPADERHHISGRQTNFDNGTPALDMPYTRSSYGSPRDDDSIRPGIGISPANSKGISVLDAPLPASFDSNGISNAARFPAAPWPSSVPSKFGLDSPVSSFSNSKGARTSETLKLLHSSAFGSSDYTAAPTPGSPPNSQPANGDDQLGRRFLLPSRQAKLQVPSSSLPKTVAVDRDWETSFTFNEERADSGPENYVPENLRDLLTPAEKARRGSVRGENELVVDSMTRYASPIASSPSRWSSLFQRQKEEDEVSRVTRNSGSVFGHVGSPLRKSTLAQEMKDDSRGAKGPGRAQVGRLGGDSMSVLSQQLQHSRLQDSPLGHNLHSASSRIPSTGPGAANSDQVGERHVSSGSVNSTVQCRATAPTDEEDPTFMFSMEEEDDVGGVKSRQRISDGSSIANIGSYAAAVAGKATTSDS